MVRVYLIAVCVLSFIMGGWLVNLWHRYAKYTPGNPSERLDIAFDMFANVTENRLWYRNFVFIWKGCGSGGLQHFRLSMDVTGGWQRGSCYTRRRPVWRCVFLFYCIETPVAETHRLRLQHGTTSDHAVKAWSVLPELHLWASYSYISDPLLRTFFICIRLHAMKPKNPALGSFARASTLSLGSIAFGSLIVTILNLMRILFQILQNMAAEDGDGKIVRF